uniref:Sodium voltage-gated channel beta subunit 4 n=1 Tax=Ornithorhynchus anatinus TaxID=9258 RepID=A0A6I8P1I4_ORNAN
AGAWRPQGQFGRGRVHPRGGIGGLGSAPPPQSPGFENSPLVLPLPLAVRSEKTDRGDRAFPPPLSLRPPFSFLLLPLPRQTPAHPLIGRDSLPRPRGGELAGWRGAGTSGGVLLVPVVLALEVSVGKTPLITALNGTDILLPCTFSTCIGFENLYFWWKYNSTDDYQDLLEGMVKNEKSEPRVRKEMHSRIVLVGSTRDKKNNISIVLQEVEFADAGKYTCRVRNPKEKNAQHEATITLNVVKQLEVVDNTVTLIIVAVVGGCIGLLIVVMLTKNVILFIIKKTQEKKKECLVNSSGNDNTENGQAGSKAEQKATPKA